jgi:hypothetical protein
MNAQTQPIHPAITEFRNLISLLPAPGTVTEGGLYIGAALINDHIFGFSVANKELGEFEGEWGPRGQLIAANSTVDGMANTLAMAEAGSEIAQRMLELTIDGISGFEIGARDIVEQMYRTAKPTSRENYCWFRSGENPGSLPMGSRYTPDFPAQTTLEGFKPDEAYAFDAAWYWSSTQCSAHGAFCQYFDDGSQDHGDKDHALRVRAVRRFLIY